MPGRPDSRNTGPGTTKSASRTTGVKSLYRRLPSPVKMRRLDTYFSADNEDGMSEADDTGSDGDYDGDEQPEPALLFVSIMAVVDAKIMVA